MYKFVEMRPYGPIWSNEKVIVLDCQPCWFFRLFGAKTQREYYVGECTVWHRKYLGDPHREERCGVMKETMLLGFWQYAIKNNLLKPGIV